MTKTGRDGRSSSESGGPADGAPTALALRAALDHHRAGRLPQAAELYRRIIEIEPGHAEALHLLGLVSIQEGHHERAAGLINRAIQASPDNPVYHANLGAALKRQGRLDEAVGSYGRALALQPDAAEVHSNLGNALRDQGRLEEAEACYRQALALKPRFAEAHCNLAEVLKLRGCEEEAIACYRAAVSHKPDSVQAHSALADVLRQSGRLDEAAAGYRQALALAPDLVHARFHLANVLKDLGQLDEAAAAYRHVLSSRADHAEACTNLGNVLHDQGRLDEAEACHRQALAIKPDLAAAWNNLGNAVRDLGRVAEAMACFRQALALQPDSAATYSRLLFCLIHDEDLAPEACLAAHRAFGERYEDPLRASWQPHANDRDPERRLRVGFVSGDLRNHAVAHFIEPVWEGMASGETELWVYSNQRAEDAVTARLRGLASHWRTVAGLTDAALADLIRADAIDILVDLSGHTGHNRLLTFARKPAPLQATWIGYPSTIGLAAIDYLICDRYIAPPGLYEHYYGEKFARLPSTGVFEPYKDAPPINGLPALARGHITFGSFNRPSKLGDSVIAAWSDVLTALPEARLLLGHMSGDAMVDELTARFACHGIGPERLDFRPKAAMGRYLGLHHEMDIAFDAWPYTGGTTTNHALWMGVPVVTVRGPSRAHCQSGAAMGRIGLGDWVADDAAGFVRIAVERARDLEALARLRATMRERWAASPLLRSANVGQWLEAALRTMWQRWCAGLPPAHFEVTGAGHD